MLSTAQSRHLSALMQCAGSDNFPRLLIAAFRRALDCNTVAIMTFSDIRGAAILDAWVEDPALNQVFRDVYIKGAYRLDPFFHHAARVNRPSFVPLRDISPDRFFTTEYFRRYYRRAAFSDEMGFLMPYGEETAIHLSVSRRGTDRRFSRAERRDLEALSPVLGALLEQHYGPPKSTVERVADNTPVALRIEAYAQKHLNVDLTRREAQVLQHVLEGYSNVAIGLLIDVSPLTVKVHRRNAYRKLGISSQAELFAAFIPALAPRD